MASAVNKVIVTNVAKLTEKYTGGMVGLQAKILELIGKDSARGITTLLVDLSDEETMATYGFAPIPVMATPDAMLYKDAIDKVYTHFDPVPDYLMLLGSFDVIPHVPLVNPLKGETVDGDEDHESVIPSDLPYASKGKYNGSTWQVKDFPPSRVVGRLPNLTNDKDPAYLIGLLDTAATYSQGKRSDYDKFLGISAKAWINSTNASLGEIFGMSSTAAKSPPREDDWLVDEVKSLSHYVNCHGGAGVPLFLW